MADGGPGRYLAVGPLAADDLDGCDLADAFRIRGPASRVIWQVRRLALCAEHCGRRDGRPDQRFRPDRCLRGSHDALHRGGDQRGCRHRCPRPRFEGSRTVAGESTTPISGEDDLAEDGVVYGKAIRNLVVACFAMGGFVSLAYEVVWSRMLVVYQGTSIYAFSSMLAVILTGMALGSYLAGLRIDRWRNPLGVLTALELAVALFGAVAIHLYPIPSLYLGKIRYIAKRTVVINMFMVPGLLVGPMGLLWGMIFPVMARCYTQSKSEAGRSIGTLYAWNTLGCIAGSLVGGFVLIPTIGASHSSVVLVGISLALGVVLCCWSTHSRGNGGARSSVGPPSLPRSACSLSRATLTSA